MSMKTMISLVWVLALTVAPPGLPQSARAQDTAKQFYRLQFAAERFKAAGIIASNCNPGDPAQCAFNVESIQLVGTRARVIAIIVDGVRTELSKRRVSTPTNLLIDSCISLIGASQHVVIVFDREFSGTVRITGERPQGLLIGGCGLNHLPPIEE